MGTRGKPAGGLGCWGLLVVGEELVAPGESALIGDWLGCCKVFLVRGFRRLLAGGRWGVLGVGERQLGSVSGKSLWGKGLGRGVKVHCWTNGYFWMP